MPLTAILSLAFSFRLMFVTISLGILFSSQTLAWQQVNYNPYAVYYNNVPVNYTQPSRYPAYNYPVYPYPQNNFYYPQPVYYTPPFQNLKKPVRPVIQAKKVSLTTPSKTISNTTSKQVFIDKLLPHINKENRRLETLRARLDKIIQQLNSNTPLSEKSKIWLKKIARKYRTKNNPLTHSTAREELLSKVDIIPSSLTLAQAANESGWGKSRFATEANNLFGIWTYDKSKGLKPQNRDSDKKHLVRIFDHYGDSISYYMHTLNSHPAYSKLREIRQQQRIDQIAVDGFEMAKGLEKYSAKGDLYIKLIRNLIRQNQWAKLDITNHSA